MSLPNKNSFNVLGGELQDYAPVTDPTTDLSAEASNKMRADCAAMTRTAVRAWCAFTTDGSTASISALDFDAVYGNAIAWKPSVAYVSTGKFTVTLPATVVDARGIEQAVNLSVGWCNVENSTGAYVGVCSKVSANVFTVFVRAMSSGNLANPDSTDRIVLFVI